jgi:hypothetical protein
MWGEERGSIDSNAKRQGAESGVAEVGIGP